MQDAANEIKGEEEGTVNTAVSVDGSWQKRGYSSFNGVYQILADIINGKLTMYV